MLQLHAELDAGDIDAARIQFRNVQGAQTDKLLLPPAELPEGGERFEAQDLPDGEWSLSRPGGDVVVNRFARDRTARATVGFTGKPNGRAALAVWSPKRTLAPGEQLQLESAYR